jgi:glycosyltransferase involved in cell wall biosynthesis
MVVKLPVVSVIIPTLNRCGHLRRTLDALCRQTYSLSRIEVLVVADGCTDDTLDMLGRYEAPFLLRTIAQSQLGPAEARNRGAARASGDLLIFLDDDIEAMPSLIEAHVKTHEQRPGHVVIGYLPPSLTLPNSLLGIDLRRWWEWTFQMMRHPGHRYTYRDLLTGNFSIESRLFRKIGGFDSAFLCHEDYELGMRLIKAGIPLIFIEEAAGYHHETVNLARSFQRKDQEGKADVRLGHCHPELRPVLPLARFKTPLSFPERLLCALAFRCPAAGNLLVNLCRLGLRLFEKARLRSHWRRLLHGLRSYFYWRGVAEELGTEEGLDEFLQSESFCRGGNTSEIQIDLREGLEAAEMRLDEERPDALHLRYGQQFVGRILPQPGSEAFRGNHLRAILATEFAGSLIKAIALEDATEGQEEKTALPQRSVNSLRSIYAK